MSDQSNNLFRHRSGAVLGPDGVESAGVGPTTSLDSNSNGMTPYEGAFDASMAKQEARYAKAMEMNDRKNDMQTIMDLAVKSSKAVAT